jgi:hypothetical protein
MTNDPLDCAHARANHDHSFLLCCRTRAFRPARLSVDNFKRVTGRKGRLELSVQLHVEPFPLQLLYGFPGHVVPPQSLSDLSAS